LDTSFFTAPKGSHFTSYARIGEDTNETAPLGGLRLGDLATKARTLLLPLTQGREPVGVLDERLAWQLAHEILEQHLVLKAREYLRARPEDRQLAANSLGWSVLHESGAIGEASKDPSKKRGMSRAELRDRVTNAWKGKDPTPEEGHGQPRKPDRE